jgi:hypothetical protein
MADDDLTAALLDQIEHRNEQYITAMAFTDATVAASPFGDLRLCVAALRAALKLHRKTTVYGLSVREFDSHEPPRVWCGHSYEETENSRHAIAGNGDTLCLDKPEGDVCGTCRDESGELVEWPCGEYLAITRELTGAGMARTGSDEKETGDG